MNSRELRKKFKDTYAKYFSQCSTVVSAPHSFLWSGDFSGFYGGLTITSKIPLRFYVGIEEIGGSKTEVSEQLLAYFAEKDSFMPMQLDLHLIESISKIFSKDFPGIRVHLLSEVPLGSSLGSLGAMSACMAKIIHGKKLKNGQLFAKAWEIARKLQTGRTLGATAYTALCESNYPVVFYSEGTKYWAKPLDEITKLNKNPIWPIDFGLVFSGKLVQGAAVIASAEEVKRISEERETKLDFRRITKNPFWEDYLNFLKQITNQNLYALCDLFQKGAHENTLRLFFNTLNQYQNLLHFLEISNPEIDKIYSDIHKIANISDNRVGSGAKISGVGKGGMVLFATSFGQYREILEKQYKAHLLYASWRDGFIDEAAKTEQDIACNLYSEFISSDSFRLTVITDKEKSVCLIDKNQINDSEIPLIIDSFNQKIIIPGQSISSKELPSQKSASIIMSALLTASELKLSNKELPGSYATSRFDLQSKITTPLSKISGLEFEISGGMYDSFTLKLKRITRPVGVIEKI